MKKSTKKSLLVFLLVPFLLTIDPTKKKSSDLKNNSVRESIMESYVSFEIQEIGNELFFTGIKEKEQQGSPSYALGGSTTSPIATVREKIKLDKIEGDYLYEIESVDKNDVIIETQTSEGVLAYNEINNSFIIIKSDGGIAEMFSNASVLAGLCDTNDFCMDIGGDSGTGTGIGTVIIGGVGGGTAHGGGDGTNTGGGGSGTTTTAVTNELIAGFLDTLINVVLSLGVGIGDSIVTSLWNWVTAIVSGTATGTRYKPLSIELEIDGERIKVLLSAITKTLIADRIADAYYLAVADNKDHTFYFSSVPVSRKTAVFVLSENIYVTTNAVDDYGNDLEFILSIYHRSENSAKEIAKEAMEGNGEGIPGDDPVLDVPTTTQLRTEYHLPHYHPVGKKLYPDEDDRPTTPHSFFWKQAIA